MSAVRMPVLICVLLCAACPGYSPDRVEDRFTQGETPVVDVLFVVDDSKTMGPVQQALAVSAADFFVPLSVRSVDWQVAVVTTDMQDASRRGRLTGPVLSSASGHGGAELGAALDVGVGGSQFEAGLSAMWAALSPPLATHENAGFLRDGARLAVVVVSDEDDCSDEGAFGLEGPESCVTRPHELVSVDEYHARLLDLVDPADLQVHAVVEPGQTEDSPGCGGASPGSRYMELARKSGGSVQPLCDPAQSILTQIGGRVAGQRTDFPLSRTPDPLTIDVRVGDPVAEGETPVQTCGVEGAPGTVVPEDPTRVEGWSYDADANTVRLHGTAVPAFGQQIRICYAIG